MTTVTIQELKKKKFYFNAQVKPENDILPNPTNLKNVLKRKFFPFNIFSKMNHSNSIVL